jgi:putative ABC transport system permease protein
MLRVALKMLMGDRTKYAGLLFGITFTSFLVTFAASYFCGFMTRGFALIAENPADVWVMDPAVESAEQTTNIPDSALARVRGIAGVRSAVPLALATVDARFPNGRFQPFQVISVDDVTLSGLPQLKNGVSSAVLRAPGAVIVDPGGSEGKLETPSFKSDQWSYGEPHLNVPTRELDRGDELLINDHLAIVRGRSEALPRYPPRPLLFTTFSNAAGLLLPERHRVTFVLATASPGITPRDLASRIHRLTGLKARSSEDFKADTVRWFLINSEDVGDIAAMLSMAMSVGFGVTGVMLYMFTNENLKQYAVLKAMGASSRLLLTMILVQAGLCALLGTGLGLGLCGIIGHIAATRVDYPFRMMWFTLVLGTAMVMLVSVVAALISARPVLKLEPGVVFTGR